MYPSNPPVVLGVAVVGAEEEYVQLLVHFIRLPGDVDHPARLHIRAEGLRRQTKGSKIRGKWGRHGIAVVGQMGITLQLE